MTTTTDVPAEVQAAIDALSTPPRDFFKTSQPIEIPAGTSLLGLGEEWHDYEVAVEENRRACDLARAEASEAHDRARRAARDTRRAALAAVELAYSEAIKAAQLAYDNADAAALGAADEADMKAHAAYELSLDPWSKAEPITEVDHEHIWDETDGACIECGAPVVPAVDAD